MWEIVEEATQYSKQHWKDIPSHLSLYDYTVEKADEVFPTTSAQSGTSSPLGPMTPSENGSANPMARLMPKRTESGRVRWKGQEIKKKDLLINMVHMWGTFVGTSVKQQSLKFFFLEEPVEGRK